MAYLASTVLITAACEVCGKEFKYPDYKQVTGRFCSKECFYKSGSKRSIKGQSVTKTCPTCNKEFQTRVGSSVAAVNQKHCTIFCARQAKRYGANENKKLSEVDAAYLAGFVDGEGSIILHPRNRGDQSVSVKFSISNTNKSIMDWVLEITGVGCLSQRHTRRSEKHKLAYMWQVGSRKAIGVIEQIRPYLKIKQEQADLAIETQKRLLDLTLRKDPVWQKEFVEKMRFLNRRGPSEEGPFTFKNKFVSA